MRIVRLALIDLDTAIEEGTTLNVWRWRDVQIHYLAREVITEKRSGGEGKRTKLYVYSEKVVQEHPKISDSNDIVVPRGELQRLEEPIELFARLLAVQFSCDWSLFSAGPHVAFVADSPDELDWLNSTNGIPNVIAVPDIKLGIPLQRDTASLLSDRLDGLTLLSESLAHKHRTGVYHDLIRFFEAAFGLRFTKIDNKLTQFLRGSGMGYERDEIRQWVGARNAATHADNRTSDEILLESDLAPYIPRMRQAAYDVLFNKAVWRDRSRERREGMRFTAMTSAPSGRFTAAEGTQATLVLKVYDPFFRYMTDLGNLKAELLPKEWWFRKKDLTVTQTIEAR